MSAEPQRPTREEWTNAVATLVPYLGFQHMDHPQIWGGRQSEEAIRAAMVLTGLTLEQFAQVCGVEVEELGDV